MSLERTRAEMEAEQAEVVGALLDPDAAVPAGLDAEVFEHARRVVRDKRTWLSVLRARRRPKRSRRWVRLLSRLIR